MEWNKNRSMYLILPQGRDSVVSLQQFYIQAALEVMMLLKTGEYIFLILDTLLFLLTFLPVLPLSS